MSKMHTSMVEYPLNHTFSKILCGISYFQMISFLRLGRSSYKLKFMKHLINRAFSFIIVLNVMFLVEILESCFKENVNIFMSFSPKKT